MDQAQIEHAQRVCRQLVAMGYADKDTARSHFKDYLLYLNLGFEGDFAQILHARKILDAQGLQRINAAVPPLPGAGRMPAALGPAAATTPAAPPGRPVGMSSMVIRLPSQQPTHMPSDRHPVVPPSGVGHVGSGAHPAPYGSGAHPLPYGSGVRPSPYGSGAHPPPAYGSGVHAPRHVAPPQAPPRHTPETTLHLPEFDQPQTPRTERTLLEGDFVPPSPAASRSMLEGSAEDLLAFEAPARRPTRPRPERDGRKDGTVILDDSAIPGGGRGKLDKGLAASTEGFGDVLSPAQGTVGFNKVLTPEPQDARTSASDSNLPTQDYDSLKAHKDWGVQSTPSFDSGSQVGDDTGDQFWHDQSGEEDESPFLEPKVGGYMGEFELLEVLGQGGMGIVFKVRHQGTDDLYALKVLRVRKGAKTEVRRKRFRTEVQAMQRLKHKNIVGVHGYGRDGPFDWYVMDYIEGKDFNTLLKAQALSADQRLEVFSQITQAIVHAHKRGVIHRDLKPQNVLVDENMHVYILDFGLAKLLDDEDGMTHTGSALGTPFYMSPEQIADPRAVGPPADIFALGVVLYEIMTGVRPFTGHSAGEVGNKILTIDPPKPSKLEPSVHANIDAICMKAMEKSIERRYPSSEHLLSDLEQHRKGKSLRQESRFAGLRRWVERNRSGFMGGIAVSLLVIALMLIVAFMLWLMID